SDSVDYRCLINCFGPQFLWKSNDVTEIDPEPVFQRSRSEVSTVCRFIDLVTWASSGNQSVPSAGPLIRSESVSKSPIRKCQKVLTHRDVEIGALLCCFATTERKKNVDDGWIGPRCDVS